MLEPYTYSELQGSLLIKLGDLSVSNVVLRAIGVFCN